MDKPKKLQVESRQQKNLHSNASELLSYQWCTELEAETEYIS